MRLPNPQNLTITSGVQALQGVDAVGEDLSFRSELERCVCKCYKKMPDMSINGENDKTFFVLKFRGTKLFAVENEIGGLTIMLPEEY